MKSTNEYHWEHIRQNGGVLFDSKIIIDTEWSNISGNIDVFRREYYKKRNGKTCYMDYPAIKFHFDRERAKVYFNHKTYSMGEYDRNPVHTTSVNVKLNPDYR